MKYQKEILGILCLTIVGVGALALRASATDIAGVELDGVPISFDVEPRIMEGYTMVPLRKIFEELGALVKWDSTTQTVSARKGKKTVTMTVDSEEMTIDRGKTDEEGNSITESVRLEMPAKIVSGRTLVPVRAVSEAFGVSVDWDAENQTVRLSGETEDETWKLHTAVIDLTEKTCSDASAFFTENRLEITEGGDYTLSGTLSDGMIHILTEERVKLRLSGVSVTASEGACIFSEKADKLYLTLTEGTENNLIAENSEDGVIYAKDNLEIKGTGKLYVSSPNGHAIKASDNLTIKNGELVLSGGGDGIHVNDTFRMSGGTVKITAVGDGIDSESIVILSGGSLDIQTTATPISGAESTEGTRGWEEKNDVSFESSSKGINAEWMMSLTGGKVNISSASHAIHCGDEIEISGGSYMLSSEYEKGISAHGNLTVDGSTTQIEVQKSTEGLESKNILTVWDGIIRIFATDDGMNATGGNSGAMPGGGRPMMRPENRDPQGEFSREEREREEFLSTEQNPRERKAPPEEQPIPPQIPSDGKAPTESSMHTERQPKEKRHPDGAMQNGAPSEKERNLSDCLVIHGGDIEIYAEDDCLDSNGNLIIDGGTIKAVKTNGSITGANAVLDPDGSSEIGENAVLILACGQGSEQNLKLPQNSLTVYCTEQQTADTPICVLDEDGTSLAEYTPGGAYQTVLVASPKLQNGKTYTVSVGSAVYRTVITETETVIGTKPENSFGGHRVGRP